MAGAPRERAALPTTDRYDRTMYENDDKPEQIPIRLGGYAHSERPISTTNRRDRAVLMGGILAAHLVIVAVLVAVTRGTAEPTSKEMVEVVEYYDIATERADGQLESPTEEAQKAALENATTGSR